ncbi:MAG: UDP-N-acetylglucosamine 1-carboxyvinyltransferase [Rhodospirillaceae bacterium]|jgi:UDP-N-acetylglucosamine 1-carboxyvinyltransferase|nr:UDP-N-acetylglucosamine 1-carboxyvinyltransferase [Rhodospirillaceae bacterium]MBT6137091.1 UDP-N-acetylglucosamine 1-carboxyvinyltransferase [Rhodospirillaceae bacterium]
MDSIRIRGGNRLVGSIPIAGAKNAALPLMAAALLADGPLTLSNLPNLADIASMRDLLAQHGVVFTDTGSGSTGSTVRMATPEITSTTAPYDLVRKMRASVLVLGPLLARCGVAKVSQPGGCAIGNRPVDLHLKGLQELGAEVDLTGGYIEARTRSGDRLTGGRVVFPVISVGATENLMMAATLARGETALVNAAREPEIVDLAECLIAMGAKIEGHGGDTIHIQGVDALESAEHAVVADRIETGTYAIAAAITGGELELVGAKAIHLEAALDVLRSTGTTVEEHDAGLTVRAPDGRLRGVDVMTEPFPGFPTDLQAQFMALMSVAEGAAMITETIFENRFMHVPELSRMGANITVHHASALLRGVPELTGAPVMATDLRASVSLVLAGLAASGETLVNRVYHLDRGYDRLVGKLSACGAVIERISSETDVQEQVA